MESIIDPFKQVVVLGAQGQLGRAWLKVIGPHQSIPATRREADLSSPRDCIRFLESLKPTLIVNAAAYTQVDQAEKEVELAYQINAQAPGEIARWCASQDIPLIHYSTDYVFSGKGDQPWNEADPVAPLNTYGRSKAEGEKRVAEAGGRFLIFRTSWVYDAQGKNFVTTLLRLGKEREELRIVNDQWGAPTFARDLAQGSLLAFQNALKLPGFPSGIYHMTNAGETTWYDFAQLIFQLARKKEIPLSIQRVLPIPSLEFPTPAIRPKNSRLDLTRVFNVLGVRLPQWHQSLQSCMEEIR